MGKGEENEKQSYAISLIIELGKGDMEELHQVTNLDCNFIILLIEVAHGFPLHLIVCFNYNSYDKVNISSLHVMLCY